MDYGHYYRNFFSSPDELARYVVSNRERLRRQTQELPELLAGATLPSWLRRYVLNSADAVLTNTVLTQDGTLYTMEGVPWGWPFGGLTGTMDQRLASHIYTSIFFPDLDRRELQSFIDLTRDGRVPHGNGNVDIALGTNHVPYGDPIKSFNKTEVWTDLPQSLILQIGKSVLQTGDEGFLKQAWPSMLAMMDYLEASLEDAIPEGITTYDYMHYRPSFVYAAVLHAATLQMMAELARLLAGSRASQVGNGSDPDSALGAARRFEEQLAATQDAIDRVLWDARGFYRSCRDRETVFTSALAGDWAARMAGLEPVVPIDKALSHSAWQSRVLVDDYPALVARDQAVTRPLVHREADLNGEEIPAVHSGFRLQHVNNPWQSIAYQGVEAVFLGRTRAGLELIKRIWDKGWYEGYPWDMDHWGMHGRSHMTHPILWVWDRDHYGYTGHTYMTHPSTWSVFTALTGVTFNAFERVLTVDPRPLPEQSEFRVPVFLPAFWLMLEYQERPARVTFTTLKHFGTPRTLETVKQRRADGSATDYPLERPVVLTTGTTFTVDISAVDTWRRSE